MYIEFCLIYLYRIKRYYK